MSTGPFALDMYFDRQLADGSWTKFMGPINCSRVAPVFEEGDSVQRTSRMRVGFGNALKEILRPGITRLLADIDDDDQRMVAIAFRSQSEAYSQAADSVVDAAITLAPNAWTDLAHRNITAATFVLTSDPAGTTYVEDTDYEVNYADGLIRPLTGGALAAGDDLLASYDHGAVNGTMIRAAQANVVTCRVRGIGFDLGDNSKKVELIAHEWKAAPAGEFNLMSDEPIVSQLAGTLIIPEGKTEPFIVRFF